MYKEISKYYNIIFPLKRDKIVFVENLMKNKNKKILDVGCATGELAIELFKSGYSVTGIDIDKDMITIAKENAKKSEAQVKFIAEDMLNLSKYFKKKQFDFVLCWGNTLSHLKNSNEVKKFIQGCYLILKKSAYLSLQIVNYEKIMKSENYSMPVIINDDIIFRRFYSYINRKKLAFSTELTVKKTGKIYKNTTIHFPIFKEELLNILKEKGFGSFKLFTDFKCKEFEPEDLSVIINCIRL